ncbi:MAG: THUMP domain-containing class I SAM-dependent RNA methyltransferase, partial [Flavobacterium sp.]
LKILKPIAHFKVSDEKTLYQGVYNINWEDFLNEFQSFAIDSTIYTDAFNNSQFVSLKAKDAIVDQFRNNKGKRPYVQKDRPDVQIHIHIDQQICTVSLDTSGESLHHRGYRTDTNIAPINEVLAAGILMLSGWEGNTHFLDPMCGSGTLLIEAAMIACNIPANINRKEFAFERWKDWDNDLFDTIIDSMMKKTKEFHFTISGFDKAPSAVRKALENVKNANLDEYITIDNQDFFQSKKQIESQLHLVFNPPYGERLEINEEDFYKKIGNTFKNNYPNSQAWFITANLEALKFVGLRPSRKIKLFNGKLETRLLKYDIYAGSKKDLYQ